MIGLRASNTSPLFLVATFFLIRGQKIMGAASLCAVKDRETVGAGDGEQSTHLSYDGRPVNILLQGQSHVVYVHLSGRSPPSNSIAALLTYFDRNSAM